MSHHEDTQYSSCAKLNLGLTVLGPRVDGYHDLESVFVEIDLCDTITIEPAADLSCICIPSVTATNEDNLVYKAAQALQATVPLPTATGAKITVHKRIPTGAGMGGGSSNAATTLMALYEHWTSRSARTPEARHVLQPLAMALGSDVPFFLHGGAAYVTGRGEMIQPLDAPIPWSFLVVLPGIHVSTAGAYASLRRTWGYADNEVWRRPSAQVRKTLTDALEHNGKGLDGLHNDFEINVFQQHPLLQHLCDQMRAEGALYAGMSGSGSTVFGVFRTDADALRAQHELQGVTSYLCHARQRPTSTTEDIG